MSNQPAKDLSEILQILAATSGANAPAAATTPHIPQPSADPRKRTAGPAPQLPPPPPAQPPQQQNLRPDPRLIDNLPAARRYIVRHLATDPSFLSRISKLKARQHEHEQQWAVARKEIIKRHNAPQRTGNIEKLSGILQSLGGGLVKNDGLTLEKELHAYDRKVYKRLQEMVAHMEKELADLGVPLFCGRVEGEEVKAWKREVLELLEDLADET